MQQNGDCTAACHGFNPFSTNTLAWMKLLAGRMCASKQKLKNETQTVDIIRDRLHKLHHMIMLWAVCLWYVWRNIILEDDWRQILGAPFPASLIALTLCGGEYKLATPNRYYMQPWIIDVRSMYIDRSCMSGRMPYTLELSHQASVLDQYVMIFVPNHIYIVIYSLILSTMNCITDSI